MELELLEKLRGESSREYIIRVLKSNIINFNLKPGQNISEKEIADKLQISRTPVREAFIRLSQEELLEVYPQRGTSVSLIDLDLVEEARFARATLEKAVVRLACEVFENEYLIELEENLNMQEFCVGIKNSAKLLALDEKFHKIIFRACKKDRTYALIEGLNSHFDRIRMLRITASINLDMILQQHKEIMYAIKEKNPDKAEQTMEEHLTTVKFEQKLLKKDYPEYFK